MTVVPAPFVLAFTMLVVLTPVAAEAAQPEGAGATSGRRAAGGADKIEFTEETLDNGLHVIYAPLRQAPVVHVRVFYHVGSRDEKPDRQGFAHMFEHMMFRGSAHVAPEEHMKRVGTVGGYSNAYTSFDETVYINTVPAPYLDMALWLEADRMASFKVSDEIFQTERKVVAEEWRMRMNQPYGNLYETFLKNAYTTHSYRWTPIGDMEHLRAASSSELQAFFNTYYLPNNATLVIAGDFDLDQTKQLVRKYYGWIPKGPTPPRDQIKPEPEQTAARNVEASEAVPLPLVLVGYHIPPYLSDDNYALAVLDVVLGSGDSSRLNRLLVNNDAPLCVGAQSINFSQEDAGMFAAGGTVLMGKDPQQVRRVIDDAFADVVKNGITAEEMEKARTVVRMGVIQGRETADALASQLGRESLFGKDANRVNTALAKIEALTPADVQQVAAKYFRPERATTLTMKPSVMAAMAAKTAATQAAQMKNAPVAPSVEPIKPRVDVAAFPADYPKTAPGGDPAKQPEFAKGTESAVNGVKLIVMPDHRLPLVNWSLTMRRGAQSDPTGKEGLSWLTSEMVRRGVEGMNFQELTKDLDTRAISISVGNGGDYARLNGSSTTDQLDHAIERSRQILRTPTFPAEEFAKLKEQSINSLQLEQDSPTAVAGKELTMLLYGDTPIGRSATPQSVRSITLDDVKQFYQQFYRPNEAVFIVSGDVTVERGQALAKRIIEGWEPAAALPKAEIKLPEQPGQRRILLVDRPDGKQATVRLGVRAYDVRSDEKFAGSVGSRILSAGIDSRLGKYVRATKGLAYGVNGGFFPNRQAGAFTGGTDTALETAADAVEAMFKVFDDMRKQNVTDAELADAKSRVSGSMVMAVQTIEQQAGYRAEGVLNDYPIDYYDKYPQRIAQVTAEEIRELMNKYVKDDRMTIVVVAPAEQVRKQLERLGEVQVVPMPAKRDAAEGTTTTQPASTQPAAKKAA